MHSNYGKKKMQNSFVNKYFLGKTRRIIGYKRRKLVRMKSLFYFYCMWCL